jgi:hypothetical protein
MSRKLEKMFLLALGRGGFPLDLVDWLVDKLLYRICLSEWWNIVEASLGFVID